MQKPKKTLIAPLDWGLGHATRCIPIIQERIRNGDEVLLASNGRSLALLKLHFPDLKVIDGIPDYGIHYGEKGSLRLQLLLQIPHILKTIREEEKWLEEVAAKFHLDEVISDNRYGLYNTNLKSSIITHQLFPIGPIGLREIAHTFLRNYIKKFDQCLIPDHENEAASLGGKLSHGNIPPNAHYIGPLSRFATSGHTDALRNNSQKYDYLIIISGPEPQRSYFEKLIIRIFVQTNYRTCIVGGKPEHSTERQEKNITIIPHPSDDLLRTLIHRSKHIIARSGYSTLMDLHALYRKAILIPTPGQTEQEYLASYHSQQFGFSSMAQSELTLKNIEQHTTTLL